MNGKKIGKAPENVLVNQFVGEPGLLSITICWIGIALAMVRRFSYAANLLLSSSCFVLFYFLIIHPFNEHVILPTRLGLQESTRT